MASQRRRAVAVGAMVVGQAVLAMLGAGIAILGAFVSRSTVEAASIQLPYGMVLALAILVALVEGGRALLGRRGALVAVAGWLAGLVVALLPRSAGDVILASDGYGLGYCLLGVLVIIWAAHGALREGI